MKWNDAPLRTAWGSGMKEALVELDKDHTLSLYAEDDALHLVPAALAREVQSDTTPRVPVLGSRHHSEHDGFTGTVIGHYTTREGEQGVVLEQDRTRVVHVYRVQRLKEAP